MKSGKIETSKEFITFLVMGIDDTALSDQNGFSVFPVRFMGHGRVLEKLLEKLLNRDIGGQRSENIC